MSLYLDLSGLYNTAFNDLYGITLGDANLGYDPSDTDSTVSMVTYDGASPAAPTAARVYELVQASFSAANIPIMVSVAVPNWYFSNAIANVLDFELSWR